MIIPGSLGEIAVGNKQAINTLISILDSTQYEAIHIIIIWIFRKIAVGNEQVIEVLISLLHSNRNKNVRKQAIETLGSIAVGNKNAINALISLLNFTYDKVIFPSIIESLGQMAVGNEQVIEDLICLLNSTQYEATRRNVVYILGKIAVGNEQARKALVSLLDSSHDKDTRQRVAESLEKIVIVNEQSVETLIRFEESYTTDNHSIERLNFDDEIVVSTTLNVDPVFTVFTQEGVIERRNGDDKYLTQHEIYLLEEVLLCGEDISACWSAANILAQTNPGNEIAISALLKFIISDKDADLSIAFYSLKQALDKSHIPMVINNLRYCLSNEIYENEFERFTCCFKILWQCTKHLAYPQFYQAWHATNTTTLNQLEQQYTDIYTQLKQLQPTSTTYPIPLNAANLEGKTAEKAIAKGILIKIYGEIFPKQKAENIEDIFDLENELQPLRQHLKTDKIALIFCHINPHPELINFCQQLQNHWLKIALITDTLIASPLRGFPPQHDNLLGVVQTWLEE